MKPRPLLAVLALTALHAYPAERWQVQYFFDDDKRALAINDLRFITPGRGMASGAFVDLKTGQRKPAGLVTEDGGRTWTEVRMADTGVSLFFLDDGLGWMAGASGVWKTTSFGREWKRVLEARAAPSWPRRGATSGSPPTPA